MTNSKFVIMRHEALKAGLHYDIRFRMPNSKDWDSFACRKDVPTEPGVKRMVVRTTIHTEKEALLTGTIKSGYGAGKLTKWDSGSCKIIKYDKRHMIIEFNGSKVKGIYHFISTGVIDKEYDKPTFLFFKGKVTTESCGMISRIPSGGEREEVEQGQEHAGEVLKKLKWSKTYEERN